MNVDLNGSHVAICYGYPPQSWYKQSIYTALRGQGGYGTKRQRSRKTPLKVLWTQAEETGLFVAAGREMKCLINRKLSETDVNSLLGWIMALSKAVAEYGLKE